MDGIPGHASRIAPCILCPYLPQLCTEYSIITHTTVRQACPTQPAHRKSSAPIDPAMYTGK